MTFKQSEAADRLSLRGLSRLPGERPLVVSFARFGVLSVTLATLFLAAVGFVGGVVAGTSGWYRGAAEAISEAAGGNETLRAMLLAPDRSSKLGVAERLSMIEERLKTIDSRQDRALGNYEGLLTGYGQLYRQVNAAKGAADAAATQSTAAAQEAKNVGQQLDALIAAVQAAQQEMSVVRAGTAKRHEN